MIVWSVLGAALTTRLPVAVLSVVPLLFGLQLALFCSRTVGVNVDVPTGVATVVLMVTVSVAGVAVLHPEVNVAPAGRPLIELTRVASPAVCTHGDDVHGAVPCRHRVWHLRADRDRCDRGECRQRGEERRGDHKTLHEGQDPQARPARRGDRCRLGHCLPHGSLHDDRPERAVSRRVGRDTVVRPRATRHGTRSQERRDSSWPGPAHGLPDGVVRATGRKYQRSVGHHQRPHRSWARKRSGGLRRHPTRADAGSPARSDRPTGRTVLRSGGGHRRRSMTGRQPPAARGRGCRRGRWSAKPRTRPGPRSRPGWRPPGWSGRRRRRPGA